MSDNEEQKEQVVEVEEQVVEVENWDNDNYYDNINPYEMWINGVWDPDFLRPIVGTPEELNELIDELIYEKDKYHNGETTELNYEIICNNLVLRLAHIRGDLP